MGFILYDVEFKTLEENGFWKVHHKLIYASWVDFALKQFEVLEGYKYKEYQIISVKAVG